MKILILFDAPAVNARPDEWDSLVQVEQVEAALLRLGHEVVRLAFSLDTQWVLDCLEREHPDLVFNLVESVEGVGRLLHLAPALLEAKGIRFTGGGATAMQLTSDKLAAKRVLLGAGLPTAPWHAGDAHGWQGLPAGQIEPASGTRIIVKSVWEHASLGLADDSVLSYQGEVHLLAELLARRVRHGGQAFAELYVDGREFNLALICGTRLELLPPAEILYRDYPPDKPRLVGYSAKWDERSFEYENTLVRNDFEAEDEALLALLKAQTERCVWLFSLRGYARVDFRVDQAGEPWILEVNLNPCLEKEAGFMKATSKKGHSFDQTIETILKIAN